MPPRVAQEVLDGPLLRQKNPKGGAQSQQEAARQIMMSRLSSCRLSIDLSEECFKKWTWHVVHWVGCPVGSCILGKVEVHAFSDFYHF